MHCLYFALAYYPNANATQIVVHVPILHFAFFSSSSFFFFYLILVNLGFYLHIMKTFSQHVIISVLKTKTKKN